MKRNGFTLVELLAVIAILAIVALITTPVIFDVINNSKMSTFTRSVEEMENVAIMDYNEYARGGEVTYVYGENSLVCSLCDNGADLELDFTGEIEDGSGTITVLNGEVISLNIENNQFRALYTDGKLEVLKKE